jgi:peptidoglycan/xylan/chitin deacetylase (PgdA/CDA1 family)
VAETLPRLTVALTFDPDALSDGIRRGDPLSALFFGEFSIRVGTPRILELLARHGISCTWFVPGHTLVTFPEAIDAIMAGGHELAAHGWYHEDLATLGADEQRAILDRSREAIAAVTGGPPTGIRAPYWSVGPDTLELIEAAGFVYDSSLMAGDVQPHRVRHGDRHSVAEGTSWGRTGRLIEIPVHSALNDWYHFEPGTARDGLSAPSKVLEIWTEELRYAWEQEPGGVLTITMHPECIGRGHRLRMLERFIETATALDGVEFDRLDRYVERWQASAAGRPAANP